MQPIKKHQTQETLVDQIGAMLKIEAYKPEFLRLVRITEDRLRRKLRLDGLLVRKSREYGNYMIEDRHGCVKGGPGMTLAQVIAFATTRTVLARHAIKQEIASMMYGRLQVAQVIGPPSAVIVKSHSPSRTIFLEAQLSSCTDLLDSFAMDVFGRHEGEFIVEETDVDKAGEQAEILHDRMGEGISMIGSRSLIIRACKIAKVKGEQMRLPGCEGFTFDAADLQWAMSKECQSCLVHSGGVVVVTVRGNYGIYALYLRGRVENRQRFAQAA
jgi:hypothetical protein